MTPCDAQSVVAQSVVDADTVLRTDPEGGSIP